MEIFKNFQRYTHKNQRLSIYGREVNGELEIFKLVCNSKDQFSKVYADFRYHKHLLNILQKDCHPIIEHVVIEKGDSAKYTFEKYCNLYFKKHTMCMKYGVHFEYLENEDTMIILKNTLKWNLKK